MNISDDKTNDLESYGVWVKKTDNSDFLEENQTDSQSLSADDLPDFDSTDFSDMFKDDTQFQTEADSDFAVGDFADDTDSALSTDELANLTEQVEIEQLDSEGVMEDDFSISEESLPDFDSVQIEVPEDSFSEGSFLTNEKQTLEENTTEESILEENSSEESTTEESTSELAEDGFEEVSFGDDEEISLDDFMDGGFSDESVASGNNGFEEGKGPSLSASESEELSLDDFMDGASFDMAPTEAKEETATEDEPPLEMDITFDDSVDSVETEENIFIDEESSYEEDDDEENELFDSSLTEEVSLDDFSSNISEISEAQTQNTGSNDIESEEIDLSDFGIDADAQETPVTQDVEEQKNKEVVVDYDLTVGDENLSSAPIVNEIKDKSSDESDIQENTIPEDATVVENSLLQQIVADLSGLKDEINRLKSNIEEMKNAPVVSDTEVEIPEAEDSGFFSPDDGDDTIALSGDELNNIMNSVSFTESETVTEDNISEIAETEVETEDNISKIAETETDNEAETESSTENGNEMLATIKAPEDSEDFNMEEEFSNDFAEEDDEVKNNEPEENLSKEIEDSTEKVEESFEEPVSDFSENSSEVTEDLVFEYDNDKLEEPDLENITTEEDFEDEDGENKDLPEEISIKKEDDIFVESNSSDFMESVKETEEDLSEINEEETENSSIQLEAEEMPVSEDSENITFEDDDDLPTVEKILSDSANEEKKEDFSPEEPILEDDSEGSSIEDPILEDETIEETSIEEPIIEEEVIEDASVEEPIIDNETVEEPLVDEPIIEETSVEEPIIDDETDDENIEETTTEEPIIDDEAVEEVSVEEPITEETSVGEILDDNSLETSFEESSEVIDEIKEDDNAEIQSNIAYLTSKDDNDSSSDLSINSDLKQDIKSVLLYMDQLLENLPEEKIVEFAKSEEFTTYKKLFNELGLS